MRVTYKRCGCTKAIHQGKACINDVTIFGDDIPETVICVACSSFARGHK